jgi:hypothetical protein
MQEARRVVRFTTPLAPSRSSGDITGRRRRSSVQVYESADGQIEMQYRDRVMPWTELAVEHPTLLHLTRFARLT